MPLQGLSRKQTFFLIGNGDAHLKNYSMLETEDGGLRLAPAYDIVCSKLVIPEELDSALAIRGKHNKIQRGDFETLSDYLNIPEKARDNILKKMKGILEISKHDIPDSHLPAEDKEIMIKIIEERWKRIFL